MGSRLRGVPHSNPREERLVGIAAEPRLVEFIWSRRGGCAGIASAGPPRILEQPACTRLRSPGILEEARVVCIDTTGTVDIDHALVLNLQLRVVRDPDSAPIPGTQHVDHDVLHTGRIDGPKADGEREGFGFIAELKGLKKGRLLRHLIEVDLRGEEEAPRVNVVPEDLASIGRDAIAIVIEPCEESSRLHGGEYDNVIDADLILRLDNHIRRS